MPLVFTIRPSRKSRLYFRVRVFDTLGEMRRYQRNRRGSPKVSGKFMGLCTRWGWTQRMRNGYWIRHYPSGNEVGEVLLCRKHLGSSVVTHELTHAMFAVLNRKGIKLPDAEQIGRQEEYACYALGSMVAQVYDVLYDHGYC